MKKVLTIGNVQKQSVTRIDFTGEFLNSLGKPQDKGIWFVWGSSGSGKSSYLMQLASEFAGKYPVLYNLLEEEPSDSDYIERTKLFKMQDHKKNFHTTSYDPDQLFEYLKKSKRTKVVIIDSLPYFTKDWETYMNLKKSFRNHIFIFSAHAKGKNPKTDFEDRVMFDARMKIFIDGYLATCKGRTIGSNGGTFIIYKEGYEKLNGEGSSSKTEN
jgi:uridine kinase